jgi:predicted N-acetyltransferase YhbS
MAAELDIHPASHDELVAAHRNVFDIWSKGLDLDAHVRHRLSSPTHRRAEWFVGCLDGRVVTSLGCYRMRFRLQGQELPGIAIGSVYTLGDVRGRGLAPRLIAWVEDRKRRERAALGLLYSDIKPDYYARMGYALCPSLEGWRDARDDLPAGLRATCRLIPFDAHDHLALVKKLYADYHGAAPLSIVRDEDYWAMVLEKFALDRFYALEAPGGAWAGYVRIGRNDDTWRITDYALADQSRSLAEQLYAALLAEARAGGAARVGGWLPDSPAARTFFALAPRRTEITMIKPLALGGALAAEAIDAAGRFCELDHV